jgi:hypothetical protein
MMVPRKSVSFAAALRAAGAADEAEGSPCRHCGLGRCRHRREAFRGAGAECG